MSNARTDYWTMPTTSRQPRWPCRNGKHVGTSRERPSCSIHPTDKTVIESLMVSPAPRCQNGELLITASALPIHIVCPDEGCPARSGACRHVAPRRARYVRTLVRKYGSADNYIVTFQAGQGIMGAFEVVPLLLKPRSPSGLQPATVGEPRRRRRERRQYATYSQA